MSVISFQRSGRRFGQGKASILRRRFALSAAVAASMATAGAAMGVPNKINFYTGSGTQDWTAAAGWTYGAPTAEDIVRIAGSGTLEITTPDNVVNSLSVASGAGLTPTINLKPGGSLVSGTDIIFGAPGAGNVATLNQTGGSLAIPANSILWVGLGASGVWNMSGGTTTVGRPGFSSLTNLGIAIGTGSGPFAPASTLNMSGGVINSDAVFELARTNATGILNLSGGTINVGTEFWAGQPGAGGAATITQTGGTINTGYNHYGVSSYGNFQLGLGNLGKPASYTLSGTGALNVYRNMYVGGGVSTLTGAADGEGTFTLNGGTVNIGNARQVNNNGLFVGWSQGAGASTGVVTVNNGTLALNLPGAAIVVGSYQSNTGTLPAGQNATFTVAGGQVLVPNGSIEIGRTGATGTLNLTGGLLSVDRLTWANPAGNTKTRTFNWSGGNLEANGATTAYPITNAGGTFKPGGAARRVFTAIGASGSYTQNSGNLEIDVASSGDYDGLDLTTGGASIGAANLAGGNVNVNAVSGFAPTFGASIPVITAKSITDTATWNLPALSAGNVWDRRISDDGAFKVESVTVVRSSTSTLSSGTNWTSGTWSAGTPNATDASAKLAAAGGSITVDAPVTVGYLQLDGTGSWNVGGASTLTVATSGGATGGIVAFGGAHTISAPVAFSGNAAIATQLKSTAVTLSGDISGSGTVEKNGPGSLTLTSSTSPFSGTWKMSGGSLNVASDANLGAAGASLALGNATLNVTGAFNSGRAVTLTGAGNRLNLGGESTVSGVISGTGGFTKADANLLVLGAANTYAGQTTVSAGTLRQAVANAVPANSAVTLAAGTTFDTGGITASVGSVAGAGNISNGGADLTVGNDNTSTSYSGVVSGGGAFTKNGTGTMIFARPTGATGDVFPIDGPIVVNGGTLQFNALNQSTYDLPFQDITVNAGANLLLNTAGPNGGTFFNELKGAGTVTVSGFLMTLTNSNTNFTGNTVVTGGAVASITDINALGSGGTVQFKGSGTADNGFAGGLWFEIGDHVTPTPGTFSHPISIDGYKLALLSARGNDITLDQPISGNGGVVFASSGFGGSTFRLNATNTYAGITQIDAGVHIVLGADNALPAVSAGVNGSIDLNGHPLRLGYIVSIGTPTINLNGGTLTLDSDIEQQFGGAWTGTINGAGSLVKTGGASQVFQAAIGTSSTYTGGTTIDEGTLQIIGNVNALPAGQPVTVGPKGSLQLSIDAVASSLPAGTPVTFSGDISGGGEVQITTLETIVLSGNNTYSGGTRISNGWLRVNADSNLGAPSGKIIFSSNLSNPGPVLQWGAAFNSSRDVLVETANAFLDTGSFNVSLGNVDTNPLLPQGSFHKLFGSGTLTVNHVRGVNTLSVNAGGLAIAASGGAASGVSTANTVAIAAGAKLDVKDNKLITNTPVGTVDANLVYGGISGEIQRAFNGGAWDQPGLTTSMPDAATGLTSIGVASGEQVRGLGPTDTDVFAGQTITGASTLVMYTYAGDANLDGFISGDDYAAIDFNVVVPNASGWYNGDFNYDGIISGDDYAAIDFNIVAQGAPFPTGGSAGGGMSGVTAVPEPASVGLMTLGAVAMLGRRSRRARQQDVC